MGPQFKIDSGWELYIQELHFKITTEGVLEGDPNCVRAELLLGMPETIRSVFWDAKRP
jgi:hypothetical protein